MDIKTIKKSSSAWGIVLSILVVIGIFTGMFLYLNESLTSSGIPVDSKYNQTYARLNNASNTLDNNIQEIQTNLNKVIEAHDAVQVAWNGMKGLGSVLKLPISLISTAEQTFEAVVVDLDIIPSWVKVLVFIGLLGFLVFVILSILKGDPTLIK